MSPRLLKSLPFRFMRWRFGIKGSDGGAERQVEAKLAQTIADTPELDAAVVLAFDAVHTREGEFDAANTHLYVTNDYAREVTARHEKMLFACSVHPYRKDAVAEVERCVKAGAVLMKWLPLVQNFNPADALCFPVYEALAHFKLPLLSHTGGEKSLPYLDAASADPALLLPALERGVTVIAAHCGTTSSVLDTDYLPRFCRMAREHEHFYGDTAALNLPNRSYAWKTLLADAQVRNKLVHGSDWPIISLPPIRRLGLAGLKHFRQDNWMRRDVMIKRELGLDDAYWQRGATLLRLGDGEKSS